MRSKLETAALAVALVTAPSLALAQQAQPGWYGGLSVGQSKVKMDDSSVSVAGATASSLSKNETDTAYKLFAGYRINNNFAVEGGWTDFGKFRATRTVTAPATGSLSANIKVSGFHAEGVGIVPLGSSFSIFGKIGGMYSTTKTSATSTGAVVVLGNTDRKKSELNLKWGLGGAYDIARNWAVRVEYEQVQKVGDSSTGEGDVGMFSIGAVYKF
jgi:OOP family OmpA-OmpF porin